MSDITLTVSAPGPTVDLAVVAGTSVTLTVSEGGGVSTHAGLPDLATSGHPVSAITGALSAAAAAAAYQPLDADLTAIAALSSPATSITKIWRSTRARLKMAVRLSPPLSSRDSSTPG